MFLKISQISALILSYGYRTRCIRPKFPLSRMEQKVSGKFLFSEISSSISHIYPIGPSSPSREFCLDQSYNSSLAWVPILHKSARISLSGKSWSCQLEFSVGIRPFCIIVPREKFASFSHHSKMMFGGKCAQARMKRNRSNLVENTVLFAIRNFWKFNPKFLVE